MQSCRGKLLQLHKSDSVQLSTYSHENLLQGNNENPYL